MVTISVEMLGEDKFIRGFNRFLDEIKDFSEVFGLLYADFVDVNAKTFDAEGPGWAPLSKKYAEWKLKHFGPLPIMELHGTLRASLAGLGGAEMGEGAVREIHARDAYFGTDVCYARAHQYGYSLNNLPARPIVQVRDEDKVRWGRIIHEWAVKLLRPATVEGGAEPV